MEHVSDYIHVNLSKPKLLFVFNVTKASLNSFSVKGLSLRTVVKFGR